MSHAPPNMPGARAPHPLGSRRSPAHCSRPSTLLCTPVVCGLRAPANGHSSMSAGVCTPTHLLPPAPPRPGVGQPLDWPTVPPPATCAQPPAQPAARGSAPACACVRVRVMALPCPKWLSAHSVHSLLGWAGPVSPASDWLCMHLCVVPWAVRARHLWLAAACEGLQLCITASAQAAAPHVHAHARPRFTCTLVHMRARTHPHSTAPGSLKRPVPSHHSVR